MNTTADIELERQPGRYYADGNEVLWQENSTRLPSKEIGLVTVKPLPVLVCVMGHSMEGRDGLTAAEWMVRTLNTSGGTTSSHFETLQVRDHWIELRSGTRYYFLDPKPEMILIEDVAASLSKKCRFNGHTLKFYSVAEHCVVLVLWAKAHCVLTAKMLLALLLHDVGEMPLPDVPTPMKKVLPDFKALERLNEEVLLPRFGLEYPMASWIKTLDSRIIADERAQGMSDSGNDWGLGDLEPLGVKLQFWTPKQAELEFMALFDELSARAHTPR